MKKITAAAAICTLAISLSACSYQKFDRLRDALDKIDIDGDEKRDKKATSTPMPTPTPMPTTTPMPTPVPTPMPTPTPVPTPMPTPPPTQTPKIVKDTQGQAESENTGESSTNIAGGETGEKDLETVGCLLEAYYNNLSDTDGRYGVSLSEAGRTNNSFFYIVRYAMSDEEAEEIIANGGIPTANKLVTGVSVDVNTGIAEDDWGNTWNLW